MPDYSTGYIKVVGQLQNRVKDAFDNLTKTLEFEKSLGLHNEISLVFEPYLSIWVHEQDKYLNSKMLEFSAVPQLPPDVPNIAVSSTELFKILIGYCRTSLSLPMAIPLLIWQGCLTSTCWSIIGGFWPYFVD